ncbi:MAG: hypothetical protein WA667_16650, partial [Candidatus Nitrosopolaris sp.]
MSTVDNRRSSYNAVAEVDDFRSSSYIAHQLIELCEKETTLSDALIELSKKETYDSFNHYKKAFYGVIACAEKGARILIYPTKKYQKRTKKYLLLQTRIFGIMFARRILQKIQVLNQTIFIRSVSRNCLITLLISKKEMT